MNPDLIVKLLAESPEYVEQLRLNQQPGCPECKGKPGSNACVRLVDAAKVIEVMKVDDGKGLAQCSSCKLRYPVSQGLRFYDGNNPAACVSKWNNLRVFCRPCEAMFQMCGLNRGLFNLYRKVLMRNMGNDFPSMFYTSQLDGFEGGNWKIKFKFSSGALSSKRIKEQFHRQRGFVTYPYQSSSEKKSLLPVEIKSFEELHYFGPEGISESSGFALTAKGKKAEAKQEGEVKDTGHTRDKKKRKLNPLETVSGAGVFFDSSPETHTVFAVPIDPRTDSKDSLLAMHCRMIDEKRPDLGYTITNKLLQGIEDRVGQAAFWKWTHILRRTCVKPTGSKGVDVNPESLERASEIIREINIVDERIKADRSERKQLVQRLEEILDGLQENLGVAIEVRDSSLLGKLQEHAMEVKIHNPSQRKKPITAKTIGERLPEILLERGIEISAEVIGECIKQLSDLSASHPEGQGRRIKLVSLRKEKE